MSEPEISRRCLECGAAVRAAASFCPQCGNTIRGSAAGSAAGGVRAPLLQADGLATGAEISAASQFEEAGEFEAAEVEDRSIARATVVTPTLNPGAGPKERFPSAFPGAAAATPQTDEDNASTRGARLLKVSTVVLEESSHDPSLRFVLVAAGIFLLFLVVLVLSKLIG